MSDGDSSPRAGGGVRVLVSVAAFVVVVAGLNAAAPIVVPILAAIFLATITVPPIALLAARGLPTWLAALVVLLVMLGVLLGGSWALAGTATQFTADMPRYQQAIGDQINLLSNELRARGLGGVADRLPDILNTSMLFQAVGTMAGSIALLAKDLFFVLVATLFILAEVATLPTKARAAFGSDPGREGRLRGVVQSMQRYIFLKTQTSALTAILVFILLLVFGVPYAPALSLLAFGLNFVPIVGSIIASIPPLLLVLVDKGLGATIGLGLGYAVINVGIGNFIEPRLFGKSLGLSPLVVFLSLVIWGWILGPVGMFLSVPLTMFLKILVDEVDDLRWIGIMLGSSAGAKAEVNHDGTDGDASRRTR
ncbi:MAG: AI-2E family transporter [Planctomycetota bacterium]|nr:AI-2E family transporter [Planctomycetota bacterium]